MSVQPADLFTQLRSMREDLSRLQARVTDLTNMLNELSLPEAEVLRCPKCNVPFRSTYRLAEHDHNSHGGPVPTHYLEIEARVDEYAPADATEEAA